MLTIPGPRQPLDATTPRSVNGPQERGVDSNRSTAASSHRTSATEGRASDTSLARPPYVNSSRKNSSRKNSMARCRVAFKPNPQLPQNLASNELMRPQISPVTSEIAAMFRLVAYSMFPTYRDDCLRVRSLGRPPLPKQALHSMTVRLTRRVSSHAKRTSLLAGFCLRFYQETGTLQRFRKHHFGAQIEKGPDQSRHNDAPKRMRVRIDSSCRPSLLRRTDAEREALRHLPVGETEHGPGRHRKQADH